MHGESPIKRRESRKIWVGSVPVGGDAPIAVQSMTNSDTNDVAATVAQINRLEAAGVDIVRVSVPDMDAAEAFGRIKQQSRYRWWPTSTSTTRSRCAWPNWASIACGSTRAISVVKTGYARWWMLPVIAGSRSVSGSTPVPWKKTCRKNTANRPRLHWWSRRCVT